MKRQGQWGWGSNLGVARGRPRTNRRRVAVKEASELSEEEGEGRRPTPICTTQHRTCVIQKRREDRLWQEALALRGSADFSGTVRSGRDWILRLGIRFKPRERCPILPKIRELPRQECRCGRMSWTSLGSTGTSGIGCSDLEFDLRRGSAAKFCSWT